MIVTTLGIRVAPDHLDQATRVIKPLLGPTRTEPGCISCNLYRSSEEDARLILVEQWESLSHLKRHIQSENYCTILSWIELSIDTPEIHFDTITETRGLEMIEAIRGQST